MYDPQVILAEGAGADHRDTKVRHYTRLTLEAAW
jgi:hypothetical protein